MKLSTRSKYGLRAMLVLALSERDGPLMTGKIAEREALPAAYLEQLMMALRKAGLVIATRGQHGGYELAGEPGDISLARIIEALEGPLEIADCADVSSCCRDPRQCALKDIFDDANRALYGVFDNVSLAELAERQRAKQPAGSAMYFI